MWDVFVTLGILVLFVGLVITPVIAFILRLFTKRSFLSGWIVSTIILELLLIFIVGTALVVTHFEEQSYYKKTDQRFEEMSDQEKEENLPEKVLMEVYKTGTYDKKYRSRSGSGAGTVSYVVKNYNQAHFVGKATIYILLNGEIIDETKVELDLSTEEELSDFVNASTLNIKKKDWHDIEFDYSIHGDFK